MDPIFGGINLALGLGSSIFGMSAESRRASEEAKLAEDMYQFQKQEAKDRNKYNKKTWRTDKRNRRKEYDYVYLFAKFSCYICFDVWLPVFEIDRCLRQVLFSEARLDSADMPKIELPNPNARLIPPEIGSILYCLE